MACSKSPTRLEAERLCRKFPDTASRTLAKRLSKSHKCTVEQARTHIRTARGIVGKRDRKLATSPREPRQAGELPEMPPSKAEPWLPFVAGNGKFAILSDVHIPFHSVTALHSAVKYCKDRKPDTILLNGDWADFYVPSKHESDPSKRDFKGDMIAVRDGLSWLRGQFPKQEIILKAGNHEERWTRWLWSHAPEISDDPRMSLGAWIDAEKHGITVVEKQRPIMVGKLPIFHGHELPKGMTNPVNPARGVFMRTMSTMLIGHQHRTSHHVEPDWRHIETSCWSTGCLCNMNPEYARINKWNHGFAFVTTDSKGEFSVDNLRIGPEGQVWE